MEPWTTIGISLATLFIGYVAGIYLPGKFRDDDKKPKVSIGPFQSKYNLFEITNHGGDVLNFTVQIKWLQEGKEESRKLEKFLNASDDPLRVRPHFPGSLKKGETKRACECPMYSDNGKVQVCVGGESVDGEKYLSKFELLNVKK
jgi:hypothetical protein